MPLLSRRRPLERAIENRFVRKMKERFPHVKIRKLNGEGYRSWPDRMVCIPGGRPLMIEFKRPGNSLSPDQEVLHAELKELGYDVVTCDDAEQAYLITEAHMVYAKKGPRA